MRYFRNSTDDSSVLRRNKPISKAEWVLLHPVLLTAIFMVIRTLCNYVIFGKKYDLISCIVGCDAFLEFTYSFYLVAFCAHLLLSRDIRLTAAALAAFFVMAYSLGIYSNSAPFFIAFAYMLFLSFAFRRLLPIAYALFFVISYISIFLVVALASPLSIIVMFIACPLAWTFYFKFTYKETLLVSDKDC